MLPAFAAVMFQTVASGSGPTAVLMMSESLPRLHLLLEDLP